MFAIDQTWLRRKTPGRVATTATSGVVSPGSAAHLRGVYFQNHRNARFQFVPYRGAATASQALLAGQIDLFCPEASATADFAQDRLFRHYSRPDGSCMLKGICTPSRM